MSRKNSPLSAAYTRNVVAFTPLNWRERKIERGRIGVAARRSTAMNAPMKTTPPIPAASTRQSVNPMAGPDISAPTIPASDSVPSAAPR